jgi:hypothetical protein
MEVAGQTRTRTRLAGLALLALLALSACDSTAEPAGPRPQTFDWRREVGGAPLLCTLGAAIPPVTGVLDGRPDDPELVWLHGPDRERISVAWPAGFSVAFAPDAVLRDERGIEVAGAGDVVELGQVNLGSHAGTPADPYLATGLVFSGCYNRS